MKKLLPVILLLSLSTLGLSEPLHFISRIDGDWNSNTTWRLSSGAEVERLPNSEGNIDKVTINHNVVLSGSGPYTHAGELWISNGGNLTITRQFIYAGDQLNVSPALTSYQNEKTSTSDPTAKP